MVTRTPAMFRAGVGVGASLAQTEGGNRADEVKVRVQGLRRTVDMLADMSC